jgi:hypothetical protein
MKERNYRAMRKLTALLAGVALFTFAAPALAQETVDVTGDWEITVESSRGTQTRVVTFEQDGNDLTGTMETRMGTTPIAQGSVNGNEISFTMVFTRGERSMELTYTATVEGDEMSGKFVTPRGEIPWTAKRKGSD